MSSLDRARAPLRVMQQSATGAAPAITGPHHAHSHTGSLPGIMPCAKAQVVRKFLSTRHALLEVSFISCILLVPSERGLTGHSCLD